MSSATRVERRVGAWRFDPVPEAAFAARDLANRFWIYAVGRGESERRLLATTPTAEGVGVALLTLFEDGQIDSDLSVGVLDVCPGGREGAETGTWIVNPYAARRR